MSTIAELKLIADSSQIEEAKKALDEFSASASKAEESGGKISSGMKSASEGTQEMSDKTDILSSKINEMLSSIEKGAGSVSLLKSSFDGIGNSIQPLSTNITTLVSSQREYVEQVKAVSDIQAKASSAADKMNSKLKEMVETEGMSRQEKALYRAEQLGLTSETSEYVRSLEKSIAAKKAEAEATKRAAEEAVLAKQRSLEIAEQEKKSQQGSLERARSMAVVNKQLAEAERQAAEQRAKLAKRDEEIAELRGVQEGNRLLAEEKKKAAKAAEENTKALQKEKDEFVKLRGVIDPVKGGYEKLYAQLDAIQKLRAKGGGGVTDLQELNELEEVVNSNIKRLDTLGATSGKTAKEMAFAMRGLPSQFTDIAVSLQGGQRPLTVFLQQGGQIKDMFGGIGPAAKAMGGYVASLVTPLNMAIAAIGVIGVAAYSGSKEIETLSKSVITSGKVSSTSAREMLEYSKAAANISGNVGSAIPVVAQLVSETELTEDSIVRITAATLAWSQASGEATSDIVDDFIKIGKDPVKSVEELNSKYKFLTTSLYESVKALQEVGRSMDASKLASEALAQAIEDDARLTVMSLGTISTAWHNVSTTASSAWDKLKSLGRVEPPDLGIVAQNEYNEALAEATRLRELDNRGIQEGVHSLRLAEERLDKAQKNLDAYQRKLDRDENQGAVNSAIAIANEYEKVESKLYKAKQALAAFDEQASAGASKNKLTQEQIIQYASVREQLERDIINAQKEASGQNLVNAAKERLELTKMQAEGEVKVGAEQRSHLELKKKISELNTIVSEGSVLRLTAEEKVTWENQEQLLAISAQTAEIEKNAELEKKAAKERKSSENSRVDSAEKMLQKMVGVQAILTEQLDTNQKLSKEERVREQLLAQIKSIEEAASVRTLTVNEKSILANKEKLISQQNLNVSLEDELRLREIISKVGRESMDKGLALNEARNRLVLAKQEIGMTQRQKDLARERMDIETKHERELADLARNSKGMDAGEYQSRLALIEQSYATEKEILEEFYTWREEIENNGWMGLADGLAAYEDSIGSVSDRLADFTTGALTQFTEGVSGALANAIVLGDDLGDTFYKLGQSILVNAVQSIIELGIQTVITQGLQIAKAGAVARAEQAAIMATSATSDSATATTVATQSAAAATTATAWTPAAILSSIGSFGTAAAIGLAAVVAAMAFGGFKSGGYTGGGGVNDVAGVVHGQEFVFDAASTARIGVGNLEALRSGKGGIGGNKQSSGGSGGDGGGFTVNTVVNVEGTSGMTDEEAKQQGESIASTVKGVVISVLEKESRQGGMLWNMYGGGR